MGDSGYRKICFCDMDVTVKTTGKPFIQENLETKKTEEEESRTGLSESPKIKGMLNYDVNTSKGELTVKIICLGDSAVGKSK